MPLEESNRKRVMQFTDMTRRMSGPYNLNTYVLTCKQTRETVIIDPGGPTGALVAFLREEELLPVKLIHTHGHADQVFSVAQFKAAFPVDSCLHKKDDDFFKDPVVRERTRKAVGLPPPYPADVRLKDKDQIVFGKTHLRVMHTPGHTPGSVCLLCEDHLFTGDAIFVGEAGRTDLPGGDLELLIHSIQTRILPLDRQTVIHPGHHHTGTAVQSTIGQEMKDNIYITDFILDL